MPIFRHPLMPSDPEDRGIRTIDVDPAAHARLSASLDLLRSKGPQIVKSFYSLLFERFPGVRAMFPSDMDRQRTKLLDTLLMVVEHMRDPQRVMPVLQDLGRRHQGYGARAEHYPIVCSILLECMGAELGKAWTDQLEAEWSQSLFVASQIMIRAAQPDAGGARTKTHA